MHLQYCVYAQVGPVLSGCLYIWFAQSILIVCWHSSCHENQDYRKSSNHILQLERNLWDICLWYLACLPQISSMHTSCVRGCAVIKQAWKWTWTDIILHAYFCSRRWNWGHRLSNQCSIQRGQHYRIHCRIGYYIGSCMYCARGGGKERVRKSRVKEY